jgi:hypothetical protein
MFLETNWHFTLNKNGCRCAWRLYLSHLITNFGAAMLLLITALSSYVRMLNWRTKPPDTKKTYNGTYRRLRNAKTACSGSHSAINNVNTYFGLIKHRHAGLKGKNCCLLIRRYERKALPKTQLHEVSNRGRCEHVARDASHKRINGGDFVRTCAWKTRTRFMILRYWDIQTNSVITSWKGLNVLCRYKRVFL